MREGLLPEDGVVADRTAHVDDELGLRSGHLSRQKFAVEWPISSVFAHHAKGKNIEPVVIHSARLSAVSSPPW